jgi:hypothetical protein
VFQNSSKSRSRNVGRGVEINLLPQVVSDDKSAYFHGTCAGSTTFYTEFHENSTNYSFADNR